MRTAVAFMLAFLVSILCSAKFAHAQASQGDGYMTISRPLGAAKILAGAQMNVTVTFNRPLPAPMPGYQWVVVIMMVNPDTGAQGYDSGPIIVGANGQGPPPNNAPTGPTLISQNFNAPPASTVKPATNYNIIVTLQQFQTNGPIFFAPAETDTVQVIIVNP